MRANRKRRRRSIQLHKHFTEYAITPAIVIERLKKFIHNHQNTCLVEGAYQGNEDGKRRMPPMPYGWVQL